MQPQILNKISYFLPETVLIVTLVICIFADLILKKKSVLVTVLAIVGLLVSGYFVYMQYGLEASLFKRMIVIDPYSVFFKFLFILSTIFILLFALTSKEFQNAEHTNEHTYLFLSLALGAFLMASSVNMLMMYLSLELVSLTSYILAGYTKKEKRSSEAAMKYVIYGAASSGIMIYAMSLLYGYTGTMNIYETARILSGYGSATNPMIIMAIIMIMAGFGYKISSVPFHFWTPDVYEGSPIPVTAFLAVTSSAAGFAVMIRFFATTFLKSFDMVNGAWQIIDGIKWTEIITVLAIASMIIGNFVAIWQSSMKRPGLSAMFVYLMAYLFMNLGAFYATMMIANKLNSDNIEEMKGLGYRSPFVCVSMGVFMFALSGVPATAGFIGKFYLFSALIEKQLIWLAVVGLLNSVVSLFFYVKVLKYMFLMKPDEGYDSKIQYSYGYYIMLLLFAIPTIFFGLYFTPLLRFAEASAVMFGLR
ncbi:MAG: NADH-quinone oxidoreductase subunit N [Ignavibacteriae bacterium]|nr:NADH-quinone oxidoreductase subunit N [Ignavibacteriota bacterium]